MIKNLKLFFAGMAVMAALNFVTLSAQERHPRIRAAIRALQAARAEMQEAAHDFCGHRVNAMRATNAALEQLNLALACDRR